MHDPDRRQSWDEYFLLLAAATATRATCSRRKVGAVIVRDRRIVSTGYNGGPSGMRHCTDGGCPRADASASAAGANDACIAIHAVANALLFSAPADRGGATVYCTDAPCFGCGKLLATSGVGEVVAAGGRYAAWDATDDFLRRAGVRVRLLDGHDAQVVLDLAAAEAARR